MAPLDPVDVVRRAGGILRRAELLELCTRRSIDKAIRDGDLERHGRSSLVLPGLAADRAAAHRTRGVLVGLSAARAWGWKVKLEPRSPQAAVPRNRHHTYDAVQVVRRDISPSDIAATGSPAPPPSSTAPGPCLSTRLSPSRTRHCGRGG